MNRPTAAETKYWYFRFTDNIFDFDMLKMERKPGGYEYVVILLKLYAVSTRYGGLLIIPITSAGSPDLFTLAEWIHHRPEILQEALEYFIKEGFAELLQPATDETEYVLSFPIVKDRIGESSKIADDKRRYRNNKKAAEALPAVKSNTSQPIPTVSKEEERIALCTAYGVQNNVFLLEEEYKELQKIYENANYVINKVSLHKSREGKTYSNDYAAVLTFAEKDGKLRVKESEQRTKLYTQYKREALSGCRPPESAKEVLTRMQFEELEKIAEENWNK